MSTTLETKPNWFKRNWILFPSVAVIAICGIYVYYILDYWRCHPAEAGQFGDMFGAITAVIGSLTFIFLIYSIHLQRQELEVARNDYKLALAEMKKQNDIGRDNAKTNKRMRDTARLQRIENTFFKVLDLLKESREKLLNVKLHNPNPNAGSVLGGGWNSGKQYYLGDDFFEGALEITNIRFWVDKTTRVVNSYNRNSHQDFVNKYTQKDQVTTILKDYLIHIYTLFDLLADANLSLLRTKFYLRILSAHISRPEEKVLAYYYLGLHPDVEPEVLDMAIESDYFKDIDAKLLPLMNESFMKIMYPTHGEETLNS